MTDVVKKRGGHRFARGLLDEPLPGREVALDLAQTREEALHHVSAADRVREAGVLGARKSERGHPSCRMRRSRCTSLVPSSRYDDRVLGGVERDEAVHGVAKDHVAGSLRMSARMQRRLRGASGGIFRARGRRSSFGSVATDARGVAAVPSTKCARTRRL